MKTLLKLHILVFFIFTLISCSSNNVGQDDLSIKEIEDIEKTGEFSEDDFFKDEEVLKESGVAVDLEGFDEGTGSGSGGDELISDIDIEDIEGEGFDSEDDFETDLNDKNGIAEFDEFDEFVTDNQVAKNEDININNSGTAVAGKEDSLDINEQDIFSEFEESEVALNDSKVADQDLSFENAFEESEPALENQDLFAVEPEVTEPVETTIDDSISTEDDIFANAFDDKEVVRSEPIAKTGKTAKQILGDTEEPTARQLIGNTEEPTARQLIGNISQTVRDLVPVKKMAEVPFRRSGILLNSLYIVRSGDNFKSIGEKIYGPGSSFNLSKVNPALNSNRLQVGDKVYYNSPNRPNDESRLLFHYDDIGRSAQYRQIASGENIRTVSKEMLGHPRSWMEVWATNAEVSASEKTVVNQSYRLRFFPDGVDEPVSLAQNNNPQDQMQQPEVETAQVATNVETTNEQPAVEEAPQAIEPESPAVAANEDMSNNGNGTEPDFNEGFDEPPQVAENDPGLDPGSVASNDQNQGFDEPPTDESAYEDPNSAAIAAIPDSFQQGNKPNGAVSAKGPFGLDKKMLETVAMGGVGFLLLLIILLVARRRRQQYTAPKVDEFDFGGNTQINDQTKTNIDI